MISNLLGQLPQQAQQNMAPQAQTQLASQYLPRRPPQYMDPMQRNTQGFQAQPYNDFNNMALKSAMPQQAQNPPVSPQQMAMINQMMQQATGRNAMPEGARHWGQMMQQQGPQAVQQEMGNSMEAGAHQNKLAQLQRLMQLPAFAGLNRMSEGVGQMPGMAQGQSAAQFISDNIQRAMGR